MAEIKIEKKRPVWPWILLILGIAALIYFLVFRDEDGELIEQDDRNDIEVQDTSTHFSEQHTLYFVA